MIKVLAYDGGLKWGSIDDIGKNKLTFIEACTPKSQELKKIAEKTEIPLVDIEEAIDPEERPRTLENEHYSLIIFRTPVVGKKGLSTTPIALFFNQNLVFCIRHTNVEVFDKLYELSEENKKKIFEQGSSYLTYWLIDNMQAAYFPQMDKIEDRINRVEAKIYKDPRESLIHEIFYLKKVLIYFHKAITANREVITSLEKAYLKHINSKHLKSFMYIYNDTVQLLDMESTYRDILTSAMDIYLTSVSNNLNIIIRKMTALGSIVLIPTLITGIYGMNFNRMPEISWVYGYPFALGLMIASALLLFIYFRIKKWL